MVLAMMLMVLMVVMIRVAVKMVTKSQVTYFLEQSNQVYLYLIY